MEEKEQEEKEQKEKDRKDKKEKEQKQKQKEKEKEKEKKELVIYLDTSPAAEYSVFPLEASLSACKYRISSAELQVTRY